ncbi:MAG TPA: ABC transporter permease, partial [Iamia sp.]
MTNYGLFFIVGLGMGAAYAALAMGLVVIHKGTGTINFAQGAMAVYGAYVYDEIRKTGRLVLPVGELDVGDGFVTALILGLATAALLGLAVHLLVFRRLRAAPPLAKVVASVGLMIALQALVVLRFDGDARAVAPILPNEVVRWGSLSFSRDRLYLTAIVVLLGVALWAYFRFTRIGLATRAASENERAASLSGFSPELLAGGAWVLSSTFTGLVAILAAPSTSLNPTNYTLFVIPALAVALLARLDSLAVACLGGLLLGAGQSEISLLVSRPWWPEWATVGVADALPFVLIVIALFAFGGSLPDRGAVQAIALPPVFRSRNRPWVVAGGTVAGLAALVVTSGSYRFGLISSMIFALIALSWVVLTGLVGQISLAQAGIAGAAGFVLSKVTTDAGIPFPLSLLVASACATVLGVAVGVPALRIRGAQLAVVTLAGAVALERFVFRNPYFSPPEGNPISSPSLFGIDLSVRRGDDLIRLPFGVMVLVVLVLAALAVGNLTRSDTGRMFLAVRSNERAAAAAGIDVAATKLTAFAIASFLAGVGGCLIGYSRGQLSADSFTIFVGVSLLAWAYLGGITSVSGALIAGVAAPLGISYVVLDRNVHLGRYYVLISGIALIATAVQNPNGIVGRSRASREAMAARRRERAAARGTATGIGARETTPSPSGV